MENEFNPLGSNIIDKLFENVSIPNDIKNENSDYDTYEEETEPKGMDLFLEKLYQTLKDNLREVVREVIVEELGEKVIVENTNNPKKLHVVINGHLLETNIVSSRKV